VAAARTRRCGAFALLAARALTDPEARVSWLAITLAMALWPPGDLASGPTAHALDFGSCAFGYAGLVVASMPWPWRAWLVLDGLEGYGIEALWLFGFAICCAAAWARPGREPRVPQGWGSAATPVIGGVAAIALPIHAGIARDGTLAVLLAGAALVAGIARGILPLADDLAMLRRARLDATTDKLTGTCFDPVLVEVATNLDTVVSG
jgi:hypothetical protein